MISRIEGASRLRDARRTVSRVRLLVTSLLWLVVPVAAGEVVVAVHPHTGVAARELTANTLRAVFGMRLRTWPDGSAIRVYVLPDNHSLHIQFCKEVLGVFPYQLRMAWDRLVYSGTGQAPSEVDSIEDMRTEIAQSAGAVGYLMPETLSGAGSEPPAER